MDNNELQKIISARPIEDRQFARYRICPQCNQIMTGKPKKLKQVAKDLWVHMACYMPFVNAALASAKRRIAIDQKAERLSEAEAQEAAAK